MGALAGTDAQAGESQIREFPHRQSEQRNRDVSQALPCREAVHAIRPRAGHFLVETPKGTYRAKTCAIAIGILGRPMKPDWPRIWPNSSAQITIR